ncbi:copper chaperone PCu(A)C, partial [Campylobacter coli]|nr:copper chaperone PCu(A)C [Campylobacter coli]
LFKLNQAIDENTKANLTLTFDNNQSLEVRDIGSKKL